jgi:RimJ/RimL family protein N-acetyltransferase
MVIVARTRPAAPSASAEPPEGEGPVLGGIGLHPRDWRVPSFEIGYWLRRSAEGHGYASEATRLLTSFVFEGLGAARLTFRCDARNVRSKGVPERLGFVYEGCARRHHRDTSGELADMLTFALTPQDYERARLTWPDERAAPSWFSRDPTRRAARKANDPDADAPLVS